MNIPIRQDGWQLVYKHNGSPVWINDKVVTTKRDEVVTIVGGRPPHHAGSTGRVEIQHANDNRTAEYFPQCFDLEWQQHGGCDKTTNFAELSDRAWEDLDNNVGTRQG